MYESEPWIKVLLSQLHPYLTLGKEQGLCFCTCRTSPTQSLIILIWLPLLPQSTSTLSSTVQSLTTSFLSTSSEKNKLNVVVSGRCVVCSSARRVEGETGSHLTTIIILLLPFSLISFFSQRDCTLKMTVCLWWYQFLFKTDCQSYDCISC